MEYFRRPIRPDDTPDLDIGDSADIDPESDVLPDEVFGIPNRSRPGARLRARIRAAFPVPSRPRFGERRSPDVPRFSRSARSSDAPSGSGSGSGPGPGSGPVFGLDRKALAILAVASVVLVGSVAAFALSGEEGTVAGDVPSPSTVTTFPVFPTASVMPPQDADEQPDGGVIRAPELPAEEDPDTDGDPDTAVEPGTVAVPPGEEADTDQPDVAVPEPPPAGKQRRGDPGSGADGAATAPVEGYVITSPYAQAGNWTTGYHTGIDLAVPVGTPVVSVRPGAVLIAATDARYGHYLLVRHAEHEYSLYAHLSRLDVERGTAVEAGQQIGLSGATGNVTGPHLHLEVRTEPVFGTDIDPVAYLAAHGVRL